MKKTKLALFVLGLTAGMISNVNAEENVNQFEQMAVTTEQDASSVDKKAEEPTIVLKDAEQVMNSLRKEISESDVDNSLDRNAQARSILLKEQMITSILQERANQRNLIEAENKSIIDRKVELDKIKAEEEKAKKEDKAEEDKQEKAQATQTNNVNAMPIQPMIIPDIVSALSVYGTNNNLFGEIKVNNNKYLVQKGQKFGDGYQVLDINRDGVRVVKDGVEQFVNVSAAPVQFNNVIQEPLNIPNMIVPNQLYK